MYHSVLSVSLKLRAIFPKKVELTKHRLRNQEMTINVKLYEVQWFSYRPPYLTPKILSFAHKM